MIVSDEDIACTYYCSLWNTRVVRHRTSDPEARIITEISNGLQRAPASMAARGETTGETNYRKSLTTGSPRNMHQQWQTSQRWGLWTAKLSEFLVRYIFMWGEYFHLYFFLYIITCRIEMIPDEYFFLISHNTEDILCKYFLTLNYIKTN